jgi:hypothetical protein
MANVQHKNSGVFVGEAINDGTGCSGRVSFDTCICGHCGERFAIDYSASEQTCPLCETTAQMNRSAKP